MARKNFKSDHSSTIHFDSRTNTVMAQSSTSHNHVKQKVNAVREVVPGKSFDEIVLVLQYYDYNSEKAIQAYLEDGATEALTQWHFSGSKVQNKRKKSKKGRAEEGADNSSTNSLQNISNNNNDEKIPVINGDHTNDISSQASIPISSGLDQSYPDKSSSMHTSSNENQVADAKPQRNKSSKHKHSGHHAHQPAPPPPPKEHHHGRVRTVSECSTTSLGLGDNFTYKKAGLERSVKDLQRQTISLERLRLTFDSEMEKGPKKIKSVFEEVRKADSDLVMALVSPTDKYILLLTKLESYNFMPILRYIIHSFNNFLTEDVFESRQHLANDLKRRIANADALSEHDLSELRADVKHFVSERRLDEDLAKTTRFMYAPDHILEEIKSFGEIVPLKQHYTARRPSTSSVASSGPNHDLHPPHTTQQQHHHKLQHHNTTSTSDTKSSAATTNGIDNKTDDGNESDEAELTAQDLEDLQQRLQNSLRLSKGGPRNRPRTANSDQDNAKRRPQEKNSGKSGETRNRSPQKSDKKSTENGPRGPKKEKDGQTNGPRSPKKERDGQANGPRKEGENQENGPRREGSGRGRGGRGRGRGGRGRGGGARSPNNDSTANTTPGSKTTQAPPSTNGDSAAQ
ncbi:hypothetical protein LOTGIDRAFT_237429 [Lottia gigantea]|uniref:CUE domain-containing protein n=1 Tax=Lottia gigantea TaxID=225164 RepID=V4CP82_LOTGI|nr:hypothetical protein LOTGIDRAFT_237429 [Lottia gigantea]ESP04230.1 hypothetical protein LOTGIDRAFT_237429 [Lottia gigantea]